MTWLLELFNNGVALAQPEQFEQARDASRAGNVALETRFADDVTVRSGDNATVYYQFSRARMTTEVDSIAGMLLELDRLQKAMALLNGEPMTKHAVAGSTWCLLCEETTLGRAPTAIEHASGCPQRQGT
jgi:hypothetical protein